VACCLSTGSACLALVYYEVEAAPRYDAQAREAGELIAEEDDRELFERDLATRCARGFRSR
jgi:hypothetical protein